MRLQNTKSEKVNAIKPLSLSNMKTRFSNKYSKQKVHFPNFQSIGMEAVSKEQSDHFNQSVLPISVSYFTIEFEII